MHPTPGLSVEIHEKTVADCCLGSPGTEKTSWDSDWPDYECVRHDCIRTALAVCGKTCSDF